MSSSSATSSNGFGSALERLAHLTIVVGGVLAGGSMILRELRSLRGPKPIANAVPATPAARVSRAITAEDLDMIVSPSVRPSARVSLLTDKLAIEEETETKTASADVPYNNGSLDRRIMRNVYAILPFIKTQQDQHSPNTDRMPDSVFECNREWADSVSDHDHDYFKRLAAGQTPKVFWIGCCDSRVMINDKTGFTAGQLFIVRNVATCCLPDDVSFQAALEYAVDVLKVEHIVVCGHYNCGGVQAVLHPNPHGENLSKWIMPIMETYQTHKAEVDAIPDEQDRWDRMVDFHLLQQVSNVCQTPAVQAAWQRGQHVTVHGWIFNIRTGLLHEVANPHTAPMTCVQHE